MESNRSVEPFGARLADVLVAPLSAALSVGGSYAAQSFDPGHPIDPLGYGLLVAGAAVLVTRRRRPVVVLGVTAVAALTYYALGYAGLIFPAIPLLVALYTAVAAGRRVPALAASLGVLVAFLVTKIVFPTDAAPDVEGFLWASGFVATAVVLGEVSRGRRDYLSALEDRALEAERTREEEGRRRAGEERLRIARELHDALGHSISLINVQAGVAAHLLDERPDQARTALITIKDTSKEALQELRATLGALRGVDEDPPRAPAPSLSRLEELVARSSAGGLPVEVSVTGDPRELPPSVDRAAYRIVQESLTNVARHAEGARAIVTLDYRPTDLVLQIDDDGRPLLDGRPGRGSGILGMRERALATGGEFEAGPRSQGGFRVRASLPLDEAP